MLVKTAIIIKLPNMKYYKSQVNTTHLECSHYTQHSARVTLNAQIKFISQKPTELRQATELILNSTDPDEFTHLH